MTHTPGPWTISHGLVVAKSDNSFVADCKQALAAERLNAAETANARLIAAAPDLLAALERIANAEHLDTDSFVCDFDTLQSIARAAIYKARG